MDWARDGRDWPNREHSRFIDHRPHRWHVQEAGKGPTLLLLHGAGGATQSWRHLLPLLAGDHHVVAPDLPGQGFTKAGTRQRNTLARMAEDIAALCRFEDWSPDLIVGHSAGGALALELAPILRPRGVVGINPALGTFEGMAGWLFPMMAKLLSMNPFVPLLFSRMATSEKRIAELLASTGSRLDAQGIAFYRRLAADRGHVDGTLAMMAQWDVEMLAERLPFIDTPCLFLVGEDDGTVPPRVARDAAARMPHAEVRGWEGRGHLLHEEAAEEVAKAVSTFLTALPRSRKTMSPRGHVENQ
jgi:magnesium chelatase accessory protein